MMSNSWMSLVELFGSRLSSIPLWYVFPSLVCFLPSRFNICLHSQALRCFEISAVFFLVCHGLVIHLFSVADTLYTRFIVEALECFANVLIFKIDR